MREKRLGLEDPDVGSSGRRFFEGHEDDCVAAPNGCPQTGQELGRKLVACADFR